MHRTLRLPRLSLSQLPRRTLSTSTSTSALPALPLKVSTLANGIRVATDPTPGHFVAAGVYVDAGSRYEGERTRGAGHLVDRLGFRSTKNRTSEEMTKEIESLGGQFQASSSRETIMYQSSTYSQSLPSVLSILSDTVLNPLITAEELDSQRSSISWEVSEIKNKPELILPEILHKVAYKGNTLGNPLLCDEERLKTISTADIKEFMDMWYRPERIVVAAAGVEHEKMVELVEQYFGEMQATTSPLSLPPSSPSLTSSRLSTPPPYLPKLSSSSSGISKFLSTSASSFASVLSSPSSFSPDSFEYLANAPAHYTGGELYLDKPSLEFTHFYVGYEGLSIHDPDIYALATLQVLLGGGGSFSAGGPGKGMYSRLYTSVLNQHHSVDYCAAFHHCYLDSGLFGLSISVHPSFVSQTPNLLVNQLDSITRATVRGGISQGDLERARNQLKSSLAMALESRIVQVEDLGRQVQVHGHKVSMDEMTNLIDSVTLSDLYRVASRVLRPSTSSLLEDRKKSGKPTIVVQGDLGNLPDVMESFRRRGLAGE